MLASMLAGGNVDCCHCCCIACVGHTLHPVLLLDVMCCEEAS
jgi:hypothetical protein